MNEDRMNTSGADGQATLTAANVDRLEASIKGTLNPQASKADLINEWKGGMDLLKIAVAYTGKAPRATSKRGPQSLRDLMSRGGLEPPTR